jgi:tetratricopeptide (TPR) repeat protein
MNPGLPINPLVIIFLFLLIRKLTVVFHELGHAIPALLLTREPVTIYIGSYGDPEKSIHFNIGRLEVWFKYNPVLWRIGLCVPKAKSISYNRQFIYILGGPMASLIIGLISFYYTFSTQANDFVQLTCFLFLISAIFDVFLNLVPSKKPIILHDGSIIFNDGYALVRLFRHMRFPPEYKEGIELLSENKYNEATVKFNTILKKGSKAEEIYRMVIIAEINSYDFENAKIHMDYFMKHYKMQEVDYINAGVIYSNSGQHIEALRFYENVLDSNPRHAHVLNNKGYTLSLMNRDEEAIRCLDESIKINPDFAYAYNNRGLSKIKTGNPEEGLADINRGLELDKDNAYGYKNLGIYHLEKKEPGKALALFRKAKEMDQHIFEIDDLIAGIEKSLQNEAEA